MKCVHITKLTFIFCSFSSYEETLAKKKLMTRNSDFPTVATVPAFVDKTMLLTRIFQGSEFKLVTAPQGFGKSTNLDMIKTFLSIPFDKHGKRTNRMETEIYRIFRKLQIYRRDRTFFYNNFGMFPVLHIDFQTDEPLKNYEEVFNLLKYKIHTSFQQHAYLCDSEKLPTADRNLSAMWIDLFDHEHLSDENVKLGFVKLSECLHRHFGTEVFVTVDQYDSFIIEAVFKLTTSELRDVIKLVIKQLTMLMKSNPHVSRAVVTGMSYIASVGLFGVKNIERYRFLEEHPLDEFYGFTEGEVNRLFKNRVFNLDPGEVKNARLMYNGYVSKTGRRLYRAQGVVHFLQTGKATNYWKHSSYSDILMNVFKSPLPSVIEDKIDLLLTDNTLRITVEKQYRISDVLNLRKTLMGQVPTKLLNTDLLLSHFLEFGYLTYDVSRRRVQKEVSVKVPNNEIKESITDYFLSLFASPHDSSRLGISTTRLKELLIKAVKDNESSIFDALRRHGSAPDWQQYL